jgi:hypothetical protein
MAPKAGAIMSQEQRDKIAEAIRKKWQDPAYRAAASGPRKPRGPHSPETIEKIREAAKKRTMPQVTRAKIAASKLGKKRAKTLENNLA